MPNIKGEVLQVDESVIYKKTNTNFNAMVTALQKDKGVSLSVDQAYLSVYDLVDELRRLVKNKNVDQGSTTDTSADSSWTSTAVGSESSGSISALLDVNKSIESIVDEGNFDILKEYVDGLSYAEFEPSLIQSYEGGLPPTYPTIVYPYPNKTNLDPRRSGRFIKPKPEDVFKQVEVQKWIVNNGLSYGFVLYGDDGLFYVDYEVAVNKIKTATNKEEMLNRILRRFIKPSNNAVSLITLNTTTLLKNTAVVPSTSLVPSNSDLEYLETTGLLDNNGAALQVVVIDKKPVQIDTAKAFLSMRAAALRDGINIAISSGYRPALGKTFNGIGSKGTPVLITTQEALRRDSSRWIGYNKNTMTPDSFAISKGYADINDYVLRAPSNDFSPATAPPKKSNHGIGAALDLNTGSRNTPKVGNFQPEIYTWLVKNSYKFGFVRAVSSEEWHFEYTPNNSSNPYTLLAAGDNSKLFYSDLGLSKGQFPV